MSSENNTLKSFEKGAVFVDFQIERSIFVDSDKSKNMKKLSVCASHVKEKIFDT